MKKLAFLFISLGLISLPLTSCSKDDSKDDKPKTDNTEQGSEEIVATAIRLNRNELALEPGMSETLTVTFTPADVTDESLEWRSSDVAVAEVADGVVTGVDAGTAKIIVKHGDLADTCFVTVTLPVPAGAVDMGLSVYWAACNLGADNPEDYGDYYAWGETETKEDYSIGTYKWCDGDLNKLTKYNTNTSYGTVDNKMVLDPEDDIAHIKLGGKWRMPKIDELNELKFTRDSLSYKWEWKSLNGHNGWLVTYLVNDNSIFLPAAGTLTETMLYNEGSWGYYWSSSVNSGLSKTAQGIFFCSDDVGPDVMGRYAGRTIRPVVTD